MNTWIIILGVFISLSLFASILVVTACIRSSQISRELESSESKEIYTLENQAAKKGELAKESATAWR